MSDIILHERTRQALQRLLQTPSHALLIVGARGIGKQTFARYIASQIVDSDLSSYPYFRHIAPDKPDSISIDQVRALQNFLTLKVPSSRLTDRIVLVEDAHLLSTEAQNALLKTLEEPPIGTMLILTAAHEHALLPTIRSRAQTLAIIKPNQAKLIEHFEKQGHSAERINRALQLSGGLPGLTAALLDTDTEHPLYQATAEARTFLQKTRFERLAEVDRLSKQKPLVLDTLYILQQMAHTALSQTATQAAEKRWANILQRSYEAEAAILANGQPKLVLTHFILMV